MIKYVGRVFVLSAAVVTHQYCTLSDKHIILKYDSNLTTDTLFISCLLPVSAAHPPAQDLDGCITH